MEPSCEREREREREETGTHVCGGRGIKGGEREREGGESTSHPAHMYVVSSVGVRWWQE